MRHDFGSNLPGKIMMSEIEQQISVLKEVSDLYALEWEKILSTSDFEIVLLVGRGSSDNAALYLKYLIEIFLHVPAVLSAPSVITRFQSEVRYPKCLTIGISQSGEAVDVTEVLKYMRSHGHQTVAITNNNNSPLSKVAEHCVELQAGEEKAVAATKTYTASLLAGYQMVRTLNQNLPPPEKFLPDENWLQLCEENIKQVLDTIIDSKVVFALGRGYSFSSAHETALKMIECALIPCKSYSTADFLHGPLALASDDTSAVVYGEVPDELLETGCRIIHPPDFEESELCVLKEALFAQLLALELAKKKGVDPDFPRNIEKITKTL